MCVFGCRPEVSRVLVLDDLLVVAGEVEGPDLEFIEAVVNHGHVSVWRIRVNRLTLHVVEVQLHVVVLRRNHWCLACSRALLRVKWLQALPVVIFSETHIIDVVVEVRVLLDRLVEPLEWIVQIRLLNYTMDYGV